MSEDRAVVFVVDDDESMRRSLATFLTKPFDDQVRSLR